MCYKFYINTINDQCKTCLLMFLLTQLIVRALNATPLAQVQTTGVSLLICFPDIDTFMSHFILIVAFLN